jgi:hypothetical protein
MGGVGVGGAERAIQSVKATGGRGYAQPQESKRPPDAVLMPIPALSEAIAAVGGGPTVLPFAPPEDSGSGNLGEGIRMMAEGGDLPAGQTAIVGEAGQPELVQAKPGGGAAVLPLSTAPTAPTSDQQRGDDSAYRVATSPPESIWAKIARRAADAALGAALGTRGASVVLAQRAAQQRQLANLGLQNPALLRTSPNIAAAVDAVAGQGTAQSILDATNPNVQARAFAQLYGIPTRPGSELSDLTAGMQQHGWGVTVTSKGELRFSSAARPTAQLDEIRALGDYNAVMARLQQQGMSEAAAAQAAAKAVQANAPQAGYTVPQWMTNIANATTERQIQANLAYAKTAASEQARLRFAAPIAAAHETGRRAAMLETPISDNELRAKIVRQAERLGGVVFGKDLKDNDIITARSQGFGFVQDTSGIYVGVPMDTLTKANVNFLTPEELMTQRLANRIALKQTTQTENAQAVLAALDLVDETHALDLLVPASPQGESLASQVFGAAITELKGQTVGRLRLEAARRSPDPRVREAAIALKNLASLANSVVKATGDSGNISEADRQIAYARISRLVDGTASKPEAATVLQQTRALMKILASAPQRAFIRDTPEWRAFRDQAHKVFAGEASVHDPPPGFTPIPGTGASYQLVP